VKLGGALYVDLDGNQRYDAGEPGVPGVTVDLLDAGGSLVDTVVTGSNGRYVFRPGGAGMYVIRVDGSTLSFGLSASADADGVADGTTAVTVAVGSGETTAGVDFGHRGPKTLDQHALGVSPGAIVHLIWAGFDGIFGSGDDVALTTTADADGAYAFANLPGGQYSITIG